MNLSAIEHEDILNLRYGGVWLQDQYLSPLLYTGMQVGIGNEWWQVYSKHPGWAHVGRVDANFGWTHNAPKSNVIYALGLQGGWGSYYAWVFALAGNERTPKHSIELQLGPYLEADYMGRLIAGYINKPYSMDMSIQVEAMAGVSYAFSAKKTSYRLRYLVRTNMIGVDFVPDYWQSYYELQENGINGTVRCEGLWNHRYLNHELTFDMQFPHSTWRVGIRHEYLEYGKGDLWFSREQVSAVVGTCFRYRVDGKRNLLTER